MDTTNKPTTDSIPESTVNGIDDLNDVPSFLDRAKMDLSKPAAAPTKVPYAGKESRKNAASKLREGIASLNKGGKLPLPPRRDVPADALKLAQAKSGVTSNVAKKPQLDAVEVAKAKSGDKEAAAALAKQIADAKREKAAVAREKRLAAKTGETKKMPASGKAALAIINSKQPKQETKVKKTAKKATAKSASKAKANGKDKAPKSPKGMVVEILKLASRTNGASREELNNLTEWKGAPWKWLFKNPKNNGYCDRWGYKLAILEGKNGETRYKVEKKASA